MDILNKKTLFFCAFSTTGQNIHSRNFCYFGVLKFVNILCIIYNAVFWAKTELCRDFTV